LFFVLSLAKGYDFMHGAVVPGGVGVEEWVVSKVWRW
jgi:hypothetical protein